MNEQNLKSIETVIEKKLHNTSDVDELAQRLKKIGGLSEEMAKNIATYWRMVAGVFGVILLMVLLVSQYRQAQVRTIEDAAAGLGKIQEQYAALSSLIEEAKETGARKQPEVVMTEGQKQNDAERIKKNAEEQERLQLAMADNFELIKKGTVYADLGVLYQAVALVKQNKIKEAHDLLYSKFPVDKKMTRPNEVAQGEKITGEMLTNELATLLYLKTVVALDSSKRQEVLEQLRALAYSSQLVTFEALATMRRLASTKEELDAVTATSREISKSRPWQFSESMLI